MKTKHWSMIAMVATTQLTGEWHDFLFFAVFTCTMIFWYSDAECGRDLSIEDVVRGAFISVFYFALAAAVSVVFSLV